MKSIWLTHLKHYPMMQIEDFIKLSYQSIFGPAHLLSQPTKDKLIHYLHEEMKDIKYFESTPLVEFIGNDYYRVSLKAISLNLITEDGLIEAFYESMIHSPEVTEKLKETMKNQLDQLTLFLKENTQIRSNIEYQKIIDDYIFHDFPSTHHSQIFQELYHPHYRVIHKKYLRKIKGNLI